MESIDAPRSLISRMTGGIFDAPAEPTTIIGPISKAHSPDLDGPIPGDVELGTTGLKRSGGYVYEEWHPKLRGSKAVRVYREMRDNDATTGAVLYAMESLILQAPWHIEVATSDPTPAQVEAAAFVRSALFDDMAHTWQEFLSEALSMVPFGWSMFEVVYKRRTGADSRFDDGRIGWSKFAPRGQETLERWEFADNGDVQGMHQVDYSTGRAAFIPLAKAILFTFRSHLNNPEGRSGLRTAYRSWYFLKRLQEIEAIGAERDLAGMPVIEAPSRIMSPTASAAEKVIRAALFKIVKSIRMDEQMGVVMPAEKEDGKETGYRLRLLSTGGKRASDIAAAIDRYRKEIAMTLLAQFLHLGMDRVGSFALADSSTDLFAVALGATMDRITDTINRTAIPPLMRLNGIPQADWPRLVHGDVESRNLAEVSGYIATLVGAGAMSADGLEDRLREIANLPPRQPRRPSISMPPPPTPEDLTTPDEEPTT